MTTIRYAEIGNDDDDLLWEFEDINSWNLVSSTSYERHYTWGGYEVTIVGDFEGQPSLMTDDAQIFLIDYHQTSTGRGQRIAGLDVTVGDIRNEWSFLANNISHDRVFGSSQGEYLYGAMVDGRGGNDVVEGTDGRNSLYGGDGSDRLFGYNGRDILVGGEGDDFFTFTYAGDSRGRSRDRILDFEQGTDSIDMHDFDTRFFKQHPDLSWIGAKEFSKKLGEIRYERTFDADGEQITVVEGAIYNRKHVDFALVLEGHFRLTREDFLF